MPENKKEEKKDEESEEMQQDEPDKDEMKDRLLRMAAEFDNYKKRVTKEVENAKNTGKAELAKKLLPVLDEFELALGNLDMKTEHGKGVAIIFSNLKEAMEKEGLHEIECKGLFDPYKHEVMLTKESKEKEGTILDVVRKGYEWKDFMLRPATVIVAKQAEEKEKEEKTK